jgi:hypothetical protein
MRSEQSWSLIDPKPILLYLPRSDEYIVYWDGKVMTHSLALAIAMTYVGIYPTPEMKSAMEEDYRRIYFAGGFETRAWDHIVHKREIYAYLKRIMKPHLDKLMEGREGSEVLGWFDYSRARILSE